MARRDRLDTEDLPKVKVSGESIRKVSRLFGYFKPHRWKYYLGLFFLFLTSLTALIFPKLLGDMVDSAETAMLQDINRIALILFAVFILQAIFSFFRIYLFVNVTEHVLADLRKDTYNKLIRLPMSFFSQNRVGEMNSRIATDINMLSDTFTTVVAEFLRQSMLIVGGIAFLAYTSIELTLVMLCIVPLVAVFAVVFGRMIRRISKETQDRIAESNTIVEETLAGITNVKSFANEVYESVRYAKSTDAIIEKALQGAKARGFFASFIIFCLFGSIVGVIWYGATLVNQDIARLAADPTIPEDQLFTLGKLIQFVLYSVFVGASIGGIAEMYAQIQKAIGAAERILEIMDEEPEPYNAGKASAGIEAISGALKFDHVQFRYPSRPDISVLNGVSFEAKQGETVALVGPSGSGKSTIASLVLRFYDPNSGTITIDGIDSKEMDLTFLRNQMAIVPQDVILFGGTIRENIEYGKPGASLEEIEAAAKKANAHIFIDSFPEKYDTVVGERGIQLSGGQRQRIAIARAVLKDPRILILDEATSSLDSESERLVQEALDKLMVGRTSLVIAHRLSTIRKADRILVLDKGLISENGKHEELLAKENGLYKGLLELQMQA
ncbi:MAG: ATP-binding cassette domain-containing protein [Flavobacteriales bacterium]|nr:ATP-binding cassette domain-containing protein [Flavobacteriales bacterium]